MNSKALIHLLAGIIAAFFCLSAKSQTIDVWVDKYAVSFDSDGTGKLLANAQFGEVPEKDRVEVLARILDKLSSQNPINSNAISGATSAIRMLKVPWNDHLEKAIYALTTSPDAIARACGITVLGEKRKDAAKVLILTFQNDPDDRVRGTFIDLIKTWPDAEPIYQKYIQAHQGDPKYTESLENAKACLVINRQFLKSNSH